ncbi:MAG: hypothetical protein LBU51_02795 [Bacteroidales bacterium]|jgi:hypothetical protein|nr:hypothetical protein [Bacteroidales bacterium]
MLERFDEIRHYNKEESIEAIQKIFKDTVFVQSLSKFAPQIEVDKVLQEYPSYKTSYDFQLSVAKGFVQSIIDNSTAGVELKGFENLDIKEPHLFLANHRDIVLDTAFLQYYFFINLYPSSKIAIGDNLLSTELLVELGKINKMITVKRSLSIREKLTQYRLFADYLHHCISVEKESIWIANRNGRTKNGLDATQPGLIKMLTMSDPKHPFETLKSFNIVPVTVSYEYEPCDNLKARELAIFEHQIYEKKPNEDFDSIVQGLFGYKGKVNLVIGNSINDELEMIQERKDSKVFIDKICKIVDSRLHANYKMHHTNYIAYDLLEKCDKYAGFYNEKEKEDFIQYLNKQSIIKDVSPKKMIHYLLQIYANPLRVDDKKKIL